MRTRTLSEEKVSRALLRLYFNKLSTTRAFYSTVNKPEAGGVSAYQGQIVSCRFISGICSNSKMEYKNREINQNKSVVIK